jgi:hypothetical protein
MRWFDAIHAGCGLAVSVITHSLAPSPPVYCRADMRVNTRPSVLAYGHGRAFEAAITRRIVTSCSASARTRNAYHGLGLIGSFSGVIVMQ